MALKVLPAEMASSWERLGIDSAAELAKSPFLGALFEGFVASEIAKQQTNAGSRRELYYFRDEQGLEVDFVAPRHGGGLSLIECKAAKTVTPALAVPLQRLATAARRSALAPEVRAFLAHQPRREDVCTRALIPDVQALPWRELLEEL